MKEDNNMCAERQRTPLSNKSQLILKTRRCLSSLASQKNVELSNRDSVVTNTKTKVMPFNTFNLT